MFRTNRIVAFMLLLVAFCVTTTVTARAQYITQSGYLPITDLGASPVSGFVGGGITFNVSPLCTGGTVGGPPTVTFYVSTNTNSVGTNIGSEELVPDGSGATWVPQQAGTYYASAYLDLNGYAGCQGGPVSAEPNFLTLIISNF